MIQLRYAGCVVALSVVWASCGGEEFTLGSDAGIAGASGSSSSATTGGPVGSGATAGSGSGTAGSSTGGSAGSGGAGGAAGTGAVGGSAGAGTTGGSAGSGATARSSGAGGRGGSASTGGSAGRGGTGGTSGETRGRDAGQAGAGGRPVDASSPDALVACQAGMLASAKFRLSSQSRADYCINNCDSFWLSILPIGGGTPLVLSDACTTTCAVCGPVACADCLPPSHLRPDGDIFTWNGAVWQPSTCGQMTSCVNQRCVQPGPYLARMCARVSSSDAGPSCSSNAPPTCVDVPFDFPSPVAVEGILP